MGTPGYPLSLYVLNGLELVEYHANHRRQANTGPTNDPNLNQTIVSDIQPEMGEFEWDPINVAAGWYVLQAELGDLSAESPRFYVANGTDSSCLTATSTPGGPISGLVSHHTNVGAIVGGVIGGVVIVVLALLALFFMRRRRSGAILPRNRALSDPAVKRGGRWNGLSSREAVAGGVELPKRSHDSSVRSEHSQETAVERLSHDDIAKDKLEGEQDIAETPALPYTANQYPPAGGFAPRRSDSYGRSHARSQSQTHRAMALAALDSGTNRRQSRQSIEASMLARSPSESTYVGEPLSPPLSPEMITMNRSSSSGGNVQRRATRKPVPKYSAGGAAEETTTNRESSYYENARENPFANSSEDVAGARLNLPKLDHKSSFGEMKPMHVLMPDMPPPPRD